MKKRKGARVSPWSIPADISPGSVSPSVVIIVDDVLVCRTLIASINDAGIPYRARISNIFVLSIESNASLKSILR